MTSLDTLSTRDLGGGGKGSVYKHTATQYDTKHTDVHAVRKHHLLSLAPVAAAAAPVSSPPATRPSTRT
jgi:hypothetical protein